MRSLSATITNVANLADGIIGPFDTDLIEASHFIVMCFAKHNTRFRIDHGFDDTFEAGTFGPEHAENPSEEVDSVKQHTFVFTTMKRFIRIVWEDRGQGAAGGAEDTIAVRAYAFHTMQHQSHENHSVATATVDDTTETSMMQVDTDGNLKASLPRAMMGHNAGVSSPKNHLVMVGGQFTSSGQTVSTGNSARLAVSQHGFPITQPSVQALRAYGMSYSSSVIFTSSVEGVTGGIGYATLVNPSGSGVTLFLYEAHLTASADATSSAYAYLHVNYVDGSTDDELPAISGDNGDIVNNQNGLAGGSQAIIGTEPSRTVLTDPANTEEQTIDHSAIAAASTSGIQGQMNRRYDEFIRLPQNSALTVYFRLSNEAAEATVQATASFRWLES